MPFTDPEKIKRHYENYQKPYLRKWRKNNKEWYKYKAENRKKNRQRLILDIYNYIKENNISKERSEGFNAAYMIMFMVCTGMKMPCHIARNLRMKEEKVIQYQKNLIKNKLLIGGKILMQEDDVASLDFVIELTMLSMAAT